MRSFLLDSNEGSQAVLGTLDLKEKRSKCDASVIRRGLKWLSFRIEGSKCLGFLGLFSQVLKGLERFLCLGNLVFLRMCVDALQNRRRLKCVGFCFFYFLKCL